MEPSAPKLILVPTDFSAPSAQALRYGSALAKRFSAHLLVIYADLFMPPVDFTASAAGSFSLPREEMIEAARGQLRKFAEANIPRAVTCDTRVVVRGAVDAIFTQASESGADLIVMGTHGRTGLRRLLIGSVAEAVMRLASVPVIVVHAESKQSAATMRLAVPTQPLTKESVAAQRYARVLGDPNLLALGVGGNHDERVIRQYTDPVLTVNRFAAARLTGANVDAHKPALTA